MKGETYLSGVTFDGRQENLKKLKNSEKYRIEACDDYNKYDKNAVEIFINEMSVGFIPKHVNGSTEVFNESFKKLLPYVTNLKVKSIYKNNANKYGIVIGYKIEVEDETTS